MKFNANDYFKNTLMRRKGMTEELIYLYSLLLNGYGIVPNGIVVDSENNICSISFPKPSNFFKKKFTIMPSNEMAIESGIDCDDYYIFYEILFKEDCYEMSIEYNNKINPNSRINGIYYIKRYLDGRKSIKFFDNTTFKTIKGFNKYNYSSVNYNPSFLTRNGFSPDFSYEEDAPIIDKEQMAYEIMEVLQSKTCKDETDKLLESLLRNYTPGDDVEIRRITPIQYDSEGDSELKLIL